ncbi:MAG: recombinase family protein [Bacillota bacterium]
MGNSESGLKYAIYSRKSKFSEKGDSIENQVEMCRQYIQTHYQVKDEDILIFEDEGFSGGNIQRPKLKTMMEAGRSHQLKAIVCYRLDRISRNIGDFAKLIQDLGSLNIDFISIKEQFDTSSPLGRAMMYMASVFSQLERETIAERIRDNMHELAKTGRWLGGTTPTGYKSLQLVQKVTVDGKARKAYRLEIVEKEADLVKRIFDLFLTMKSLTKVETYLIQNNMLTKNGKAFTRFSIKNILRNPVYMIADKDAWNFFKDLGVDIFAQESSFDGKHGVIAYNKTIQETGKSNQIRSIDEWVISVGKHEGLIPGKDWAKVQNMLQLNRSKAFRKPKSHVALLSGLLYCGNCGDTMRPKLSQRVNAEGNKIFSYLCETKEKSRCKHCNIKNPNGNLLDAAVCEEIKKLSGDDSAFMEQLRKAEKLVSSNTEEYGNLFDDLQRNLNDNEKEISALVTSLAKAEETPACDYITNKINELHAKNIDIKNRIGELKRLTETNMLSEIQFDILHDLLISFDLSFDLMDIEQKRAALRVFVKRIVWDGENVHIYLFGSDDDDPDRLNGKNEEPLGEDSKRDTHVHPGFQET